MHLKGTDSDSIESKEKEGSEAIGTIFELNTRMHPKGGWAEHTPKGTIIHLLSKIHRKRISQITNNFEAAMYVQLPNGCKIEALSQLPKTTEIIPVQRSNAFLYAAKTAFYHEYDFVINPDDIWLLIAQGFGQYVNQNAEELRDKIVDFKGKMNIVVENTFLKGDPNNHWEGEFPKFGEKVREYIGNDLYITLIADFTTTGPIQRAASEIVLLYSMQKYFEYLMCCVCGVPNFLIEGSIEDWESIKSKTQSLMKYGNLNG